MILDFYSATHGKRAYHHPVVLFSNKMDYHSLFSRHPARLNLSHEVRGHSKGGYTDDATEWVATSVLFKEDSEP